MKTDYLLYDGECPACTSYIAFSRLRQLHPDIELLDARKHPGLVAELRQRGQEINVGMVMQLDGKILFGAEVTRIIALLAGDAGPLRRTVLWNLGAAPWSRTLYPLLNRGRKLLLLLLGRSLIR
ncbi:MAG TPA: DCC1-like thiol-disulfide oxidoreductase family protein [Rhizobiaceae bacterium]|nr:DCC1-like thiol-disulfide oxidoreductase family protein [Rhizobiaceae bacterium]